MVEIWIPTLSDVTKGKHQNRFDLTVHPNAGASPNTTGDGQHGGNMDPNAVRLQQVRVRQASDSSSTLERVPEPIPIIDLHKWAQMQLNRYNHGHMALVPIWAACHLRLRPATKRTLLPKLPKLRILDHISPRSMAIKLPTSNKNNIHLRLQARAYPLGYVSMRPFDLKLTCQGQHELFPNKHPNSAFSWSPICSITFLRTISDMAGRIPSTP